MSPFLAFGGHRWRQTRQNAFQLLGDELLHVLGAVLQVRDSERDSGVDQKGRPDFRCLWQKRDTKTHLKAGSLEASVSVSNQV